MRKIRRGDNLLEIPDLESDIGSAVFFNGYPIPSAGIWEIIVESILNSKKADENVLMDEAERAFLYRLEDHKKLVHTDKPLGHDIETSHPNVYIRREAQRVRALVDFFDLTIGTIEGEKTPDKVRDLIQVAKHDLGKNVVGAIDDRYFFSILSAEEFLENFGTLDWHKVAKFLKRPSPITIDVKWTDFDVFSEKENDGTLAIDPNIDRPMQGTFFAKVEGKFVLAKGIVRPPIILRKKKEAPARVAEAAFGFSLPSVGKFAPIGALGRENCAMNYQTVLFSTENPAELIRKDNERFRDISAFSTLPKDAFNKVSAGVPAGLLIDNISPWRMLGRFDIPGIRATVYGSNLVPPGWFSLLPGSHDEFLHLAKKHLGIKEEADLFWLKFFLHRDPALSDGSSMHEMRYYGPCDFATNSSKSFFGIVINPLDPSWKIAGGDFDGDSGSVFLPIPGLKTTYNRGFESLRTNKAVYQSTKIEDQIVEASCKDTANLLGPVVLSAIKLAERGMLDDEIRSRAATVAQAAVDAKKHSVDDDYAMLLARGVFEPVNLYELAAGHAYIASLVNSLKNVKGEAEKATAWKNLVKNVEILSKNYPTSVESAMIERIMLLNQLFIDVGFLRAQVRAEMPTFLRTHAKAKASKSAENIVTSLCNEYVQTYKSLISAAEEYDDEFRNSYFDNIRDTLRSLRQKIKFVCNLGYGDVSAKDIQYAMVAYGLPKLAAQYVSSEIYSELTGSCKEVITNLFGTKWTNGQYNLKDLTFIYPCKSDKKIFSESDIINLKVISYAKNSTRVHLIAER